MSIESIIWMLNAYTFDKDIPVDFSKVRANFMKKLRIMTLAEF